MSYGEFVKAILDAVVVQLKNVTELNTVAISEPARLNTVRMPAAYVLLDGDTISRKTRLLEEHQLAVVVSVLRTVKSTKHGDVELTQGMLDGLTLVGSCYDTLISDRTLGGAAVNMDIEVVDYGRAVMDTAVVFWGEMHLAIKANYAPTKPVDGTKIGKVYTDGIIE